MPGIDFSKKSLVFITGASRGIGRSIAVETSRIVNSKSSFVLIASSAPGLEETKSLMAQVNSNLKVITFPLDLSNPSPDGYSTLFDDVLKKVDVSDLEYAVFIHNAGTIGVLKRTLDATDVNEWRKYYDLNVISAITLNTYFVKTLKNSAKKLVIINISSLCVKVPFVNMGMHCSGRAAKELFFRVFAIEEPDVLVLNYSPGVVDTDMLSVVVETAQDEEVRDLFEKTKKKGVLTPKQTVDKLLSILKKGDFKSGDSVDYSDRI